MRLVIKSPIPRNGSCGETAIEITSRLLDAYESSGEFRADAELVSEPALESPLRQSHLSSKSANPKAALLLNDAQYVRYD